MSEILRIKDNVPRNQSKLSLLKSDNDLMMIVQNEQDSETVAFLITAVQAHDLCKSIQDWINARADTKKDSGLQA